MSTALSYLKVLSNLCQQYLHWFARRLDRQTRCHSCGLRHLPARWRHSDRRTEHQIHVWRTISRGDGHRHACDACTVVPVRDCAPEYKRTAHYAAAVHAWYRDVNCVIYRIRVLSRANGAGTVEGATWHPTIAFVTFKSSLVCISLPYQLQFPSLSLFCKHISLGIFDIVIDKDRLVYFLNRQGTLR